MAKLFEYDESRTKERRKRSEARTRRPYRVPTPVTPVPRRASASSPGSARVRSRHPRTYTEFQEDDVTSFPTIPRSATWQGETDGYEMDPALSLLPEFSPFLPSLPSIDELDTVPPLDANLRGEMAPARTAVVQPDYYTVQFPLEIAEPAQRKEAGLQFPVEIAEPSHPNKIKVQFPVEIAEGPEQKNANAGFPVEIAESAQAGDKNVSIEPVSFNDGGRGHARKGRADISELVTKPPPVPFQPHSVLALRDEPSYIDDVVGADTVMDDTLIVVPSLSTDVAMYATRVEDIVDVALTVRARELLRRKGSTEDRPAFIHNPLDYVRWWLLGPGRLEFLFWLGGALLLGVIMCVVLVVTGLGLGLMSFGHLAH